jgi:bifunctional UDP-N-acetylglucosamine pyrophosphorylase/glucosamine-1-phosphate N-acetyltransferase
MYHYGRVIRNVDGEVTRVIEFKDCTEEQKEILEVNISCYVFNAKWLWENTKKIKPSPTSGEYYLTELFAIASSESEPIYTYTVTDAHEGIGVNTPEQLALVTTYARS